MMFRMIGWIAAGAILAAACSGTGADEDSSRAETSAATATSAATVATLAPTSTEVTTTVEVTTTTEVATTTEATSMTSTSTTESPGEVNPPNVEAWWCDAFEAASGQDPAEFARGLADDFRHGYSDMPADTLEEGAEQAALVSCDPEYGQAVAEALVQ